MCVIIDTNRFVEAFCDSPKDALKPLLDWISFGDGRAIIGGTKFGEEISRHDGAQRFFAGLVRAGRATSFSAPAVDTEAVRIVKTCKSDDAHIIALARISGARLVCTNDRALERDVKDKRLLDRPRGKVYKTADHKDLLKHRGACKGPPEHG